MIIKVNEKASIDLYRELICDSRPQCIGCSKNHIETKVEQSIKKCDKDCLTFFCCKK